MVRVLLIEDSPAFAFLVQEYLDAAGMELEWRHVEFLRDGLELLATEHFDIIFMDQSLPDSEPTATLRTLSENVTDIPIVVMSGSPVQDHIDESVRSRAAGYLSKRDVSTESLLQAIRQYVG